MYLGLHAGAKEIALVFADRGARNQVPVTN